MAEIQSQAINKIAELLGFPTDLSGDNLRNWLFSGSKSSNWLKGLLGFGSGSNSSSVDNANSASKVGDNWTLNKDGSVDMDFGNMDINGLINAAGTYLLGANPLTQYAWSAQEAQKERDWQEQMSNTAYQRSVADMQKAGINPILAYAQGGASSGTGAVASGSPTNSASSIGSLIQGIGSIINSVLSNDRKSDALEQKAAMDMMKFNQKNSAMQTDAEYKNSYARLNRARVVYLNRSKPAETKINIIKHK